MPCLVIHLAVAKNYLKKHKNENKDEFILGTIAPDINLPNINKYINGVTDNKNSHHFGLNYKTSNMIEYMQKKVDFNLFFKNNDITTSFLKAYFLHLLCDYYFFLDYIKDERLINLSYIEALKISYNDYNLITPKIIKKYNLEIPIEIKDLISEKGKGKIELLNEDIIDSFINEMSNLDLSKEKNKLLTKSKY